MLPADAPVVDQVVETIGIECILQCIREEDAVFVVKNNAPRRDRLSVRAAWVSSPILFVFQRWKPVRRS